ncbi:7239_t:CDS:2, partial [Acaulospora colombiana]
TSREAGRHAKEHDSGREGQDGPHEEGEWKRPEDSKGAVAVQLMVFEDGGGERGSDHGDADDVLGVSEGLLLLRVENRIRNSKESHISARKIFINEILEANFVYNLVDPYEFQSAVMGHGSFEQEYADEADVFGRDALMDVRTSFETASPLLNPRVLFL